MCVYACVHVCMQISLQGIKLKICYGVCCLEKYFEMNKKNCREALDVYKKFLARMDRVCGFLKVAEVCDIYFLIKIRWFTSPEKSLKVLESGFKNLDLFCKNVTPTT